MNENAGWSSTLQFGRVLIYFILILTQRTFSLKHSQPFSSNATGLSGPPHLTESLEREREKINQVAEEARGIWEIASQS